VAQTLRPFPEYNDGLAVWFDPLGNSWYDSLQVKVVKRMSHGLDVTSNFTYQKELSLSSATNDVFNRAEQKALSSTSTPYISVTAFTYEIPKLTSNKLIRQVVGGWTFGGIMRYASGSLIGVPSSRVVSLSTYTYNTGTRFNRVPGQRLFLVNPNCRCIDPNAAPQILNPAAWVDVSPGTYASSSPYYNDYRWQRQISESMNLGRSFHIREKMYLNFRAEFFNPFNRLYLPGPSSSNPLATLVTNTMGAPTSGFGYITNPSSIGGQRNGQLVARFQF
jgi:hypothetical protein